MTTTSIDEILKSLKHVESQIVGIKRRDGKAPKDKKAAQHLASLTAQARLLRSDLLHAMAVPKL